MADRDFSNAVLTSAQSHKILKSPDLMLDTSVSPKKVAALAKLVRNRFAGLGWLLYSPSAHSKNLVAAQENGCTLSLSSCGLPISTRWRPLPLPPSYSLT